MGPGAIRGPGRERPPRPGWSLPLIRCYLRPGASLKGIWAMGGPYLHSVVLQRRRAPGFPGGLEREHWKRRGSPAGRRVVAGAHRARRVILTDRAARRTGGCRRAIQPRFPDRFLRRRVALGAQPDRSLIRHADGNLRERRRRFSHRQVEWVRSPLHPSYRRRRHAPGCIRRCSGRQVAAVSLSRLYYHHLIEQLQLVVFIIKHFFELLVIIE